MIRTIYQENPEISVGVEHGCSRAIEGHFRQEATMSAGPVGEIPIRNESRN